MSRVHLDAVRSIYCTKRACEHLPVSPSRPKSVTDTSRRPLPHLIHMYISIPEGGTSSRRQAPTPYHVSFAPTIISRCQAQVRPGPPRTGGKIADSAVSTSFFLPAKQEGVLPYDSALCSSRCIDATVCMYSLCFDNGCRVSTAAPFLRVRASLAQVDRIVVMGELPGAEGATIVDQGTYEELLGRGRDLSNILEEQTRQAASVAPKVCMVLYSSISLDLKVALLVGFCVFFLF